MTVNDKIRARPPGVLAALGRHWLLALIPVILLLGASIALGMNRQSRYTATAELSVGRIYVNNPAGVSGVLEATQSLAAVYSRAIRATAVREDAARRLGQRALGTTEQLSATPIAQSPLIKITAEAASAERATALANAASAALASYVAHQERSPGDATGMLAEYRKAAERYRDRAATQRRLARRYARDKTAANKAARDRAAASADAARLRRDALSASYQSAIQSTTTPPEVETFTRATSATSDRIPMLQIMVFFGLVGGMAAGLALALLVTYHETRPRGT